MNATKRRLPLLCSLAAVLVGIAAAPAQAGGWTTTVRAHAAAPVLPGPRATAEHQAAPARAWGRARTVTSGQCPAGMVSLHAESGMWCHHGVSAADGVRPLPTGVRAAAPVQPKCYGNGVNGARIRLLYGYIEGRPNRANLLVPKILKEWVPAMEANFRRPSREQGREMGMRLYAPNCKIDVEVVELPSELGDAPFANKTVGILNFLTRAGYKGVDRKYLLWADIAADPGNTPICGVAIQHVGRFAPVLADNPTPVNANNVGNMDNFQTLAIAYRNPSARMENPRNLVHRCWGGPIALTETHELLHTLGAVQFSSPNSDGGTHCSDGIDIMCDPNQVKVRTRCQTGVPVLDCGQDDYFSANAPLGSYLSTHWNIANSRFLGDAIGIDAISAPLPSP